MVNPVLDESLDTLDQGPPRGLAMRVLAHPWSAWIILGLSLLITGWAWWISDRSVHRRAADRFLFRTEDALLAIGDRISSYVAILRGGAGLYASGGEVDGGRWAAYVASLDLGTSFPGIQGMGFSRMIAPDDLPAHVASMRAAGAAGYRVWPEGVRRQYSAITFLEPRDWRNRRAIGFDMFSEPTRRAAMERARDTGLPAASGRVMLVQETDQDVQHGFLVYVPVYRPGLPTGSVEERRAAILGFVYAPFRIRDLMHGILGQSMAGLHFNLYDGPVVDRDRLLYEDAPRDAAVPAFTRVATFVLPGGMQWTLDFRARDDSASADEENQPLMIAIGGVIIDLLLFAIIADIARREKRARLRARAMLADLRSSEDRLARSLAAVGDGVWDWDVARASVYFSPEWKLMLGYAPDEVGTSLEEWSSRVHPDDLARTLADVEAHLAGRTGSYRNEHRMRHRDGRHLWILDRGQVIQRAADGRALRMIGTHTDITAQRALQEERDRLVATLEARVAERTDALQRAVDDLAARDRRLRIFAAVVAQTPSAIAISGTDLHITFANASFNGPYRIPSGSEIGRDLLSAILPGDRQDEATAIAAALHDGGTWSEIIRIRHPDGAEHWLDTAVLPIRGEAGATIGFASVQRDITATRVAEDEARRRTEQLIQADKMAALGTLVAGVGHEINNPANFISLNAPILKGFWEDAAALIDERMGAEPGLRIGRLPWSRARTLAPRLFQGVEEGIVRIRRIVGDLRDFARPDPGGEQPQDLNRVVQAAVAITRHTIDRATERFTCSLAADLPPVPGGWQKLEQVVVNLLLNACQALPSHQRAIAVATAYDAGRRLAVLTIADEGVGIPPEHLPRLGEPFFTTKRDHGGTGLGLSITRRIVQDHGGEIRFASRPGAGTTVTVLLPVAADAVLEPGMGRPSSGTLP